MKHFLGIIALATLSVTTLSAFECIIGPRIAISEMNYYGSDLFAENKMSLSFAGGAYVQLKFTPAVGIQADVLVDTFSMKYDNGNDCNLKYSVLSVPVYARFDIERPGKDLYALLGAKFDFRFMDRGHIEINDTTYYYDLDEINEMVVSITGEFGVHIPTWRGMFDFGIGLVVGVTEMYTTNNIKTWGIAFRAGYGFEL